jgi:hypothetical protein
MRGHVLEKGDLGLGIVCECPECGSPFCWTTAGFMTDGTEFFEYRCDDCQHVWTNKPRMYYMDPRGVFGTRVKRKWWIELIGKML